MRHDVFIRYSPQDKAVADATCAALEAHKIRCWIAPRDVLAGTANEGSFIQAIDDCRVMVLIYSGHSNSSPHIDREIEHAARKDKVIFAFQTKSIVPSSVLKSCIGISYWLDATSPPLDARIGELTERIRRIIAGGVAHSPAQSSASRLFPETDWAQLDALRTARGEERKIILDSIIQRYWKPLCEWVRHRGFSEDAEDIVQDFLTQSVERDLFGKADPTRGRFESLLLVSLKHFLMNRTRVLRAQKRRLQQGNISLGELVEQEDGSTTQPMNNETPDVLFQGAWAAEIVQRTLHLFEQECRVTEKQAHFEIFRQRLLQPVLEGTQPAPLEELAARLGIDKRQAANFLTTARRAFQRLLREEVRQYATSEEDVNEAVEEVVQLLGGPERHATIAGLSEVPSISLDSKQARDNTGKSTPKSDPSGKPPDKIIGAMHELRTPEVPMPRIDKVHFSVASPAYAEPGRIFIVDVWAHFERQRAEVERRVQQARPLTDSPPLIRPKGPFKIERGTTLFVRLKFPDLHVNPPEDVILWEGQIGNASFEVAISNETAEGVKCGLVSVHWEGGLQIARVPLQILVDAKAAPAAPTTQPLHHIRKAFASYASPDRDEVLSRVQGMQKIAPDLDVFLDVVKLRSGEDWEEKLWQVIPESDVFYLFWSAAAKASPWVEREWRCALNRRGEEFIDPVPLVSPEEVRPPDELSKKHFNDWTLAYRRGRPKPSE